MARRKPPPLTDAQREQQLTSLAYDMAEEKLLNGTASNQIILHFLKVGSTKEELENGVLREKQKHLVAKTNSIANEKTTKELYANAMKAMQIYTGGVIDEEEEEL